MKRFLMMVLALTMLLAGCSTEVAEYRQQQPRLDIFDYFQGKTEAWGMVQDRSGKQIRRFHVEIAGDVIGDTLTLNEHFGYGTSAGWGTIATRERRGISKGSLRGRRQVTPLTGITA